MLGRIRKKINKKSIFQSIKLPISQLKETINYNSEIKIRPANQSDVNGIYELLRCEDRWVDKEDLYENVGEFYVLCSNDEMIAAIHYKIHEQYLYVKRMIVHPMYPINSVSAFIYHGLLGVLARNPLK